jgi:transcriptional regulator with XRE-family HTH domain
VLRALRRGRGWRQVDLAELSGLSQSAISLIERGHWTSLSVKSLRRAFGAVEASFEGLVGWRGGSLDRLLDERHAALVEQVVAVLRAAGWEVAVEVSYQIYGERGSIDILAIDRRNGTALEIEIKTEIASAEETIRRLDAKSRLAARVCLERFGWRPRVVARCLVLPEGETHRRRVRALGAMFGVAFPVRGRAFRSWLRAPTEPASALWFLSPTNGRGATRAGGGPRRVRRPRSDAA